VGGKGTEWLWKWLGFWLLRHFQGEDPQTSAEVSRLMPSGRGQPPLVDPATASKRGLRAAAARSNALQQLRSGKSVGNL